MLKWSSKYPDEVLHYQIDWAPALATGDSVSSATADAEGADVSVVGTVGTTTTVAVSGGVAGTVCTVEFSAVTTLGETLGENVSFAVNSR